MILLVPVILLCVIFTLCFFLPWLCEAWDWLKRKEWAQSILVVLCMIGLMMTLIQWGTTIENNPPLDFDAAWREATGSKAIQSMEAK